MRSFSALLVLACIACGEAGPTADSTVASFAGTATDAVASPRRPLSGACVSTFDPPPLPLPASIEQVDNGICQLSHLGKAIFYQHHVISFATGVSTSDDTYFIAANGDTLRATSTGTFVPSGPGVRITGLMTFNGGSGRFANATGEVHVDGQADFGTNSTTFTLEGWLSY